MLVVCSSLPESLLLVGIDNNTELMKLFSVLFFYLFVWAFWLLPSVVVFVVVVVLFKEAKC